MSAREPIGRIRAVLVGIDEYENPDVRSLQGCVNDVALVRSLLKGYFAVPNEDIRVVVNRRATKAAILHRLRDMISRGQPGDVLVFYYSGHGSQVRDRDGDELTDGLDEIICPYDMDWDRRTYILDDDLDAIFAEMPPDVLLEAGAARRRQGSAACAAEPEPVRVLAPAAFAEHFRAISAREGDVNHAGALQAPFDRVPAR